MYRLIKILPSSKQVRRQMFSSISVSLWYSPPFRYGQHPQLQNNYISSVFSLKSCALCIKEYRPLPYLSSRAKKGRPRLIKEIYQSGTPFNPPVIRCRRELLPPPWLSAIPGNPSLCSRPASIQAPVHIHFPVLYCPG